MEWSASDPRIWAAIVIASQGFFAILYWIGRREFATNKQVDAADQRAADAHHRIDLLEKDIKGLPTYDVTNQLSKQLSDLTASFESVKGEIKGIDDRTERTDASVTRIEQHLLSKAS